jgi:hypothetical protein
MVRGPKSVEYRSCAATFNWSARWRNVTGGLQTGTPLNASGINIVNLKIGARMEFRAHNSLYVGYGKALTSADWYNQIVRVEYRYSFLAISVFAARITGLKGKG